MQTIYLDISNKGVVPTVYAKQGDVGRRFLAVLTDAGVPYSPPAGSAFSVWYDGDSGDGNYTDIGGESAFSVNANTVSVELIAQMLEKNGEGVLCLVLSHAAGKQIGSWNIPYVCEHVPGFESEEATSYYTAFSETVANLQKLVETDPTVPAWAKQPQKPAYTAVEVGARPNTWMPTAAQVGAAPAGYGLGEDSMYPPNNSVDEAVLNGWYYIAPSMTGAPSVPGLNSVGYGALLVINRAGLVTQEYYVEPHARIGVYAIKLVRQKNNTGAWTEWEWINPPMLTCVEYRTTERYLGKPVYVKAVDIGTLPASTTKTIAFGDNTLNPIRYFGETTTGGKYVIPYGKYIQLMVSNTNIIVETSADYSKFTGNVTVWYTKNTD